jgi:hypothetical protein
METPCELCGGRGQYCYFKGESRFLLSWEECPACCGTGYKLDTASSVETQPDETLDEDGPPDETTGRLE